MKVRTIDNAIHDAKRLKELQALPLERKIQISQARIIEWYQHYDGNVVVSFSGGKDSTVLLHLVRSIYPDVKAVFSNTGLEYPEIQKHIRSIENVDIVVPSMRFDEVLSTRGYPLVGKQVANAIRMSRAIKKGGKDLYKRHTLLGDPKPRNDGKRSMFDFSKWLPLANETNFFITEKCCDITKKSPVHKYLRANNVVPIIGTLAEESIIRKSSWIKTGCNSFDKNDPKSQPMSFWTEQDVLAYIVKHNLSIASVYGEIVHVCEGGEKYPAMDMTGNVGCNLKCTGCERTGCIFCAFGFHLEKGETRFQRLAKTHPRQYEYALGGGQWVDNPYYDPTAPEYDGEWKNWNPKKIWVPSKKGLGMKKVFDEANEIYGKDFYRYE